MTVASFQYAEPRLLLQVCNILCIKMTFSMFTIKMVYNMFTVEMVFSVFINIMIFNFFRIIMFFIVLSTVMLLLSLWELTSSEKTEYSRMLIYILQVSSTPWLELLPKADVLTENKGGQNTVTVTVTLFETWKGPYVPDLG